MGVIFGLPYMKYLPSFADLFEQLHSGLSEELNSREEEIIGFISNNSSWRILILGSAGVGKTYLLDRVVHKLCEEGRDVNYINAKSYSIEEIHKSNFCNNIVVIDRIDEFVHEDRIELEQLINRSGRCIVTMRSKTSLQQSEEYRAIEKRMDLIIDLDSDKKYQFKMTGETGTGKSSLSEYLIINSIRYRYYSKYIEELDKDISQVLENTIQRYTQDGGIHIMQPNIEIPKKEIIVPSNEIITGLHIINESIIERVYKEPDLVYGMKPREFEEFVAEIYEKLGYRVELTKATRDGGKDIILYADGPTGHNMFYVECKKYDKENPVGVRLVRNLYGVVEADKATAGILVTSSSFTKDAREFAKDVYRRLTLYDYMELLSMVYSKNQKLFIV